MFGIKTKIIKGFKKIYLKQSGGRLYSSTNTSQLMEIFKADTYGHRANLAKGDLGYGFIHYSLIRVLKPTKVLCVGSRHGYIPAVCAQACKDNGGGTVDFVDAGYAEESTNAWTGVGFWKTTDGKKVFEKFHLEKHVKTHVLTSLEFSRKFKNNLYEYIYIDGDHSYKGVLSDYKIFWPRLKKFGFMSFHDVGVEGKKPEGIYGVSKLWKEISKKSSIIFPFSGSGLGIIQKT